MPQRGASLLDRMIERLLTQRACLEEAASMIAELPGPVIELGLGKARTYDHLRRLLPRREFLVFDRELHAPPANVPADIDLYLGDFRQSLPRIVVRLRGQVALLHADIGSYDLNRDRLLLRDITPHLDALMRVGGVVVTDREIVSQRCSRLPLPSTVGNWKYYMYHVRSGT